MFDPASGRRKFLAVVLCGLMAGTHFPAVAWGSPWVDRPGYLEKTGGKFTFGLKHALFSWLVPWTEAHEPKYATQWEGYCAGLGKLPVYTAAGLIQLGTFFIPVDFPDIGRGLHIPEPERPALPEPPQN